MWVFFDDVIGFWVEFSEELFEFNCDLGGVGVEDWGVVDGDSGWVVEDDDLGFEGVFWFDDGWWVGGVFGNVIVFYVVFIDIMDVEIDVVIWVGFLEWFVVYFDVFDFILDWFVEDGVGWFEDDNVIDVEDIGFNMVDWNGINIFD